MEILRYRSPIDARPLSDLYRRYLDELTLRTGHPHDPTRGERPWWDSPDVDLFYATSPRGPVAFAILGRGATVDEDVDWEVCEAYVAADHRNHRLIASLLRVALAASEGRGGFQVIQANERAKRFTEILFERWGLATIEAPGEEKGVPVTKVRFLAPDVARRVAVSRRLEKAVAAVVRAGRGGPELLVFDHPLAGTQLPKGGIEPGETPRVAARRELLEESGLSKVRFVRDVDVVERWVGGGEDEAGPLTAQRWWIHLMAPTCALPSSWSHDASGSLEESGLRFRYRWEPVGQVAARVHPAFRQTAALVAAAVARTKESGA